MKTEDQLNKLARHEGTSIREGLIAWGSAARALPGQEVCADLCLVRFLGRGVLLAAVDGLGHGIQALEPARLAVETLARHAHEPPVSLVRRCHAVLAKTRGVVMTVAWLDAVERLLTWVGVGNVEARLFRADAHAARASESVVLRNGLVGYRLPELRASVVDIAPGDLVVLATDGILPCFADGWEQNAPVQHIADRIMERHFRGTDDALVLVARYLGSRHE